MHNRVLTWLAAIATVFMMGLMTAPAFADALDDYRKSGDIIERHDGLLEATASAPAAAKSLVQSVNTKRRSLYVARAQQQGVPASEVAKIYAKEIFEKAPKGTKFRQPNGSLVQK